METLLITVIAAVAFVSGAMSWGLLKTILFTIESATSALPDQGDTVTPNDAPSGSAGSSPMLETSAAKVRPLAADRRWRMRALLVSAALCVSALTLKANTAQERLSNATTVFNEIIATPDKSIPADLIEKSECIVIVPSMKKGGFIVGGQYGKGFATCRHAVGKGWGAPAAVRIEGGSFGLQLGGQAADIVMLVMNRRGMDQLTKSKFTLGGDASVSAGPVGRTASAQTDATMNAEILSWSRSKGLFGGISLSGATLREDGDANRELYGKKLSNEEILIKNAVHPPPAAAPLISALDRFSDRRVSASREK